MQPQQCTASELAICDPNATCSRTGDIITCSCKTGWTGNGYTCSG